MLINYRSSSFVSVSSFTKFAVLAVTVLVCIPAPAQDSPAAPRFVDGMAFVILGRIFRDSQYIDAKRDQINAEFAEREGNLRRKIEELDNDRNGLEEDRLTLTAAQLDQKNDRIDLLNIEIKRETRDLEEDKRLRFDVTNRELEKEVFAAIEQVANEQGAYIVFELSSVLFAEKSMDITAEVIKLLDTQLTASPTQ